VQNELTLIRIIIGSPKKNINNGTTGMPRLGYFTTWFIREFSSNSADQGNQKVKESKWKINTNFFSASHIIHDI